ncbi:radical SAM protein [Candidatus Bathyarchaeota archaeon]|mgnify:CR=1 FL=1|nr:MAG: radical SAM protein [Candidatus Hecatellales archaeon]RLI35055.1 MAG: radical SAM protein [Candidatus Bathyarchaeota archaeon]
MGQSDGSTQPPDLLIWILTGKCNLACSHCYASRFRSLRELSLAEALKVLRDAWEAGVEYVSFTGGEPLLHPPLFRLLEEAYDLGVGVSIVSNGSTISRETARRLSTLEVHVYLSVDGSRVSHEKLRGNGTWKYVAEAAAHLKDEDVSYSTITVLARETLRHLGEAVEFARRFDAEEACIIPVIPSGKASASMLPPAEEALKGILSFVEACNLAGIPAEVWCAPYMRLYVEPSKAAVYRCRTDHVADMDVEGNLLLCDVLDFRLANVRREGFAKAWETYLQHPFHQEVGKPVESEPCSSCPVRSKCMGGCYARALLVEGSLRQPDPLCPRVEAFRKGELQPTTL